MNVKNSEKKRMPLFWRIFLIVSLVLVLLITAGGFVFARYMSEYEASRIETVIDNFKEEYDLDRLAVVIAENLPSDCGKFLSAEQTVSSLIMPALGDDYICTKRVGEYTDDKPVYTVMIGEREIGRVSFEKTGSSFFGFDEWSEGKLEYTGDFSDMHYDSFYIKVPGGATVTLAGSQLSGTYNRGSEKYAGACAELEDPKKMPLCDLYEVGEGYDGFLPAVKYNGAELTVLSDTKTDGVRMLAYSLPESSLHTLTVTVPEGSAVYLGDTLAGDKFISDEKVELSGLSEWNAAAAEQPKFVKYVFPGLVSELTPTAKSAKGASLTPAGENDAHTDYVFDVPAEELITAKINAPDGGTVTVNGIKLTDAQLVSRESVCQEIDAISKFITNPKTTTLYEVSGLYLLPEVTITDASGAELTVECEDSSFTYAKEPSEQLKTEHEQYVTRFVDGYIKYYTDGASRIAANYQSLILPYLQPGSVAYSYLSTVYSSLAWTGRCTIYDKQIKTYDYQSWGDNAFSCKIDFDLSFYSSNSEQDTEEHVRAWQLYFVNTTGGANGWRIAKMVFDAE